uniref:Putative BURP domain-containing protein 3-like n=1 Tax=Davidia involucrata TaxID=16924 RepID=A0A5B6YII2_DAVIN
MGLGFANWFQIVLYTLLLTCGLGNGVREISKQNLQEPTSHGGEKNILLLAHSKEDEEKNYHQNHMHHAHLSSHMDASKIGFFTMKDLYVGKRMPITFPNKESIPFLPREEADSIPFSLSQLPNLVHFFSISVGSAQAKAMVETIRACELEPIKGETKLCATSLESMLDFVRGIFGLEAPFKVLTTTHFPAPAMTLQQNYTFLELPKEISASNMVACHPMPYPYAVFYCHSQGNKTKVFKIVVGGEDGNRVEAVAVCHMDTSHWSPNHISFRLLGFKPGTSPVCHFFSSSDLVWVSGSPPPTH